MENIEFNANTRATFNISLYKKLYSHLFLFPILFIFVFYLFKHQEVRTETAQSIQLYLWYETILLLNYVNGTV